MALHSGERKENFPEEATVAWSLNRRDLEENEDWCRDLVEHSQDMFCVHDLEGRFLSVNPLPARLLGYSVEEMLQTPMRDFLAPQFQEKFNVYLREIERMGEAHGLLRVVTRSGERRIWEYHNTLRTRGVPAPIVRGIAHDVTERVQAEKALRASNEEMKEAARQREKLLHDLTLFRTLLDQSNDSIKVVDLESLRFLDGNERSYESLGYSREELLSMTVYDIAPNMDKNLFDEVRQQLKETGFAIMETVHRRKDGTTFPVEVNLRRVRLDREYGVSVSRDITGRKLAEEALRATTEQLQTAVRKLVGMLQEVSLFRAQLDQSNDAIEVVDPQTLRFLDVNKRACERLGYSREELLSMTIFDIDPGLDEGRLAGVRQQLDETGFATIESVQRRKDGSTFPVEVALRRVQLDRAYGVAVARDITVRKQAEERLREFERVVENLEDMIVVVDREYRYVLANRAFLSYRGMTKEQVVGSLVSQVANPVRFEVGIREKLDECFQGKIVSFELKYQYPTMGERDIALTYLPVEGPAGIERVACILRDVTERKRAEEALRESEARERARAKELETVLDAVPVAVCIAHDAECRRITGNRAAYEQMGVAAGSNFSKSGAPEERLRFRVMQDGVETPVDLLPMQQAASQGKAVYGRPLTILREDGTVRETLATAVPLLDEAGKPRGAVGASVDVTEMKRAEAALRKSELRFRTVYERSPVGIALIDSASGKFMQVNPKFCEITGRGEEELLRDGIRDITHPDDIERSEQGLRQVAEEKLSSYEMEKRYVRPDGSVCWANLLVVSMPSKGEKPPWQMGLVQDITERKQSEQAVATLLQELSEAKRKLVEEKLYLQQEIDTELGFGEIIGRSKALQAVMEQVGKVAGSDATVLLLGETGTGKELVARAIHRLSQRANKAFIKLNCAAIPSGLLESELFGNERGAYTGAVSRKIGRLELADKGTLFLDEIGEISLMLQPKLLRVLQDQEFERLGGNETLKVDFRLIAATNRNLADSVRENEFRSDLYYRLNVFPIRVPPLRERREDIQLLVEHFVHKFAQRMKKTITSIPTKTVQALKSWEWPGNVRELENFIERSVILTQGSVLVSPLSELRSIAYEETANDERLESAEREHILRALRESRGQIGGLKGAATRLGLKRTTLQSKLKHLGIDPRGQTRH